MIFTIIRPLLRRNLVHKVVGRKTVVSSTRWAVLPLYTLFFPPIVSASLSSKSSCISFFVRASMKSTWGFWHWCLGVNLLLHQKHKPFSLCFFIYSHESFLASPKEYVRAAGALDVGCCMVLASCCFVSSSHAVLWSLEDYHLSSALAQWHHIGSST